MPSDEHLVTIVGLVGITLLVISGLIVLAVIPDTSAAVIPVVSEVVAAAKQGADESSAGTAATDKPIE